MTTAFVTILDADMPPNGRWYRCAFTSQKLATARSKTRWQGHKLNRVVANWVRAEIEPITLTHVPSGDQVAAHIHKLESTTP